jgi:hypothetical protein
VDWIGLAQDRDRWKALVNSVLNLQVPLDDAKLSSVVTTGDLSSGAQPDRVSLVSNPICDMLTYQSNMCYVKN